MCVSQAGWGSPGMHGGKWQSKGLMLDSCLLSPCPCRPAARATLREPSLGWQIRQPNCHTPQLSHWRPCRRRSCPWVLVG